MPSKLAKIIKTDRISAIWIVPIITLLIGGWIIYTHFSQQGVSFTLLANDASGIIAGKTVIKSRNVDVGIVEAMTLSADYKRVVIKGRINNEMSSLLKNDSIFWIVKPQVGREGVTGLSTLFSGVYIELVPGTNKEVFSKKSFELFDSPPLSTPNDAGIRVYLTSDQSSVIPKGAAVLFRGFRVGSVESSDFDMNIKKMKYRLFIAKPYDTLVTENVRFWKEGGVDLSISSKGARLNIPSVDVLFSGGISFDVPEGAVFGEPAKEMSNYTLYSDKSEIKDSQYTKYHEFLLFFKDSISGLKAGSTVEYRGIRLGTVRKVPFYNADMAKNKRILNYNIPVLIKIEPERLTSIVSQSVDINELIIQEQKNGLRAALKTDNILTGSVFVDLDFYTDIHDDYDESHSKQYGYNTIATVPTGLSQLQAKLIQTLDNFNKVPLKQTVMELNNSLIELQKLMKSLNSVAESKDVQELPKDLRSSIQSLNKTLENLQPGSELYEQLRVDMNKFEQVMAQLTPLLDTLNDKSNALFFAAPKKEDPKPKAKGN